MDKKKTFSIDILREQLKELDKEDQKKQIKAIREMMVDNYGNVLHDTGVILGFATDRKKYKFPKNRKK